MTYHRSAPRRRPYLRLSALVLSLSLAASACSGLGNAPLNAEERGLAFAGPDDGQVLDATAADAAEFSATATDESGVADLGFLLDGSDVSASAEVSGATISLAPSDLVDGARTLALVVRPEVDEEAAPDAQVEPIEPLVLHEWDFVVDATAPELTVDERDGAAIRGEELAITGTTEPGATVAVGDESTTADDTGAFELVLAAAPEGVTPVTATDAAGNTTEGSVSIVAVPSRVEAEDFRALHVSFYGWVSKLKPPIMKALDEGRIDAIQLDLKDESGRIAYRSEVPLAQTIGASLDIWDLEEAVEEIHAKGAPVIGRIVAFADPQLVQWAWANGQRDYVIQLPDGSAPYTGKYAGFSNFVNPDVIEYNIAIAEEAARAGVDQILWDYIRRPDGGLSNFDVPGLVMTPEEAIVEFTRMADERLAPYGVQHAASVFGIAADRPTQIGQDIPGMADYLDYVSPMIYPSHWGPGEYDVRDPNRQPYDIITATLEVWKDATAGKRARVIPWLEDTSYRAWDREFQIREQHRATFDSGIESYVMWDPNVRYTPSAYDVIEYGNAATPETAEPGPDATATEAG